MVAKSLVLSAVKIYDLFIIPDPMLPEASAMKATQHSIRFGLYASLAALAVFVIGGALAPLESAAVLQGTIMPSDYKKTVQHLEGGVIGAILVKDGDRVAAGQPLIRLSNVGASASQGVASTQLFTAKVTQARLQALQNGQPDLVIDPALQQQAAANPQLQDILRSQQQLFTANRDAQSDKLAMYTQQIAQLREENTGFSARLKSTRAQLALNEEALATEHTLLDKGYSTRPRVLTLQSENEDLKAKVDEMAASIGKNEKNIMEITAAMSNQKNEFQSKTADDLRAASESGAELGDKVAATSDVLARTVITAPIAGVVNGLKYHTVGGVIEPGSAIMDIVPQDNLLLVDAQVQPRNISRIHIGQEAQVRFLTYRSRVTPMVKGKVVQLSADRLMPPAGASAAQHDGYYLARIEVAKADMGALTQPIELTPGMPVEVMAVDGKRSLLGYYLQPFLDSFHHAFRER